MTTIRIAIAVGLLCGVLVLAAVGVGQLIAERDAGDVPAQDEPLWRVEWHDGHRYLLTEQGWHAWSSTSSSWVLLPRGWTPNGKR